MVSIKRVYVKLHNPRISRIFGTCPPLKEILRCSSTFRTHIRFFGCSQQFQATNKAKESSTVDSRCTVLIGSLTNNNGCCRWRPRGLGQLSRRQYGHQRHNVPGGVVCTVTSQRAALLVGLYSPSHRDTLHHLVIWLPWHLVISASLGDLYIT